MRILLACVLSVVFFAISVFAQQPIEPSAQIPVQAAPIIEEPAAPTPTEPIAPVPAISAIPVDSATKAPAIPVAKEPESPVPEPVVQQAPAVVVEIPAVNTPKEPLNIQFHLGVRSALGISAMRGHKAMQSPSFGLHAIKLEPALSGGIGLVFDIEINNLLTIAPELQYTFYRANGEFVESTQADLRNLNKAEVELHSVELPLLVRFNFGFAYLEVGPQAGANLYAVIYKNSELKSPDLNVFAFGPSLGFGANINGVLLGLRGHFGLLEYAKNTKGYPWAAHVSVTKFFF